MVLGAGAVFFVIRLRNELIEEEEAELRKKQVEDLGAGVTGGMSVRDHRMPNRHIVIAAVVMFGLGLLLGSAVHVHP